MTQELQKITKDKHLNVAPPRPRNRTARDRTSFAWHLQNLVRFREDGFGEVNFLKGNIGYVKLKGFRVEDTSKVAPLMNFISTADAFIIDLRGNGGGNGPVGLNLSSYFLPTNTPLSSVYERGKDLLEEYHTTKVIGKKQLDIPLFILINKRTFSAAEAFAYDLQAKNRATIVGEKKTNPSIPNHIFIQSNKKNIKVILDDILYVESIKDYIRIHLVSEKIIFKSGISAFENRLDQRFLRVHRSFIINVNKVTAYTKKYIELQEVRIPIGEFYKEGVLQRIQVN